MTLQDVIQFVDRNEGRWLPTIGGRKQFTARHAGKAFGFTIKAGTTRNESHDWMEKSLAIFNATQSFKTPDYSHTFNASYVLRVLSEIVAEIQLDRNNGSPVSISATGEVSQGTELKGRLKITDFDQPGLLTQVSGGFFMATDPNLLPIEVGQPSLRQGFLEAANTSPVTEMASMISMMRAFESNQRLVQIHDERMGRAISELGNPN